MTAAPGVELAFDIHSVANLPVARWRYRIVPRADDAGCEVTETWEDRRGGVIKVLGGLTTGVWDRAGHNRAGMVTTLERIQRAAERTNPAQGSPENA